MLSAAWPAAWAAEGGKAFAQAGGLLDFSADERRRIARHGPWPTREAGRDPGNALSGNARAIALGRSLFSDPALSASGRLSCASCHLPSLDFTDGRARAVAEHPLDRHTPTLWNSGLQRWWGWDGATDSLWSQALRPLLDAREMAIDVATLSRRLAASRQRVREWRQVFGQAPRVDDVSTLVQTGKALGAYLASLRSPRTAFDQFRDALLRGDRATASRYPLAAQRGLRLFVGAGRCHLCHAGALFSNGEFADIGLPFFSRPGVVDSGRHGGILALRRSSYHLATAWNDDRSGLDVVKTRHLDLQHRHFGEFKVPSLRQVSRTAPYMHDGQLATLDDVVRHYDRIDPDRLHGDGQRILQPLALSDQDRTDLVAFLDSLSVAVSDAARK